MADPTTVNDQITDSVTQANVKVIGEAPEMALASLYQSTAQALGMAAQNAVYALQQMAVTLQAATAMGASHIYSLASTEAPQSLAASLANANTSLAEQANANHINQQVEDAIKDTLNSNPAEACRCLVFLYSPGNPWKIKPPITAMSLNLRLAISVEFTLR